MKLISARDITTEAQQMSLEWSERSEMRLPNYNRVVWFTIFHGLPSRSNRLHDANSESCSSVIYYAHPISGFQCL